MTPEDAAATIAPTFDRLRLGVLGRARPALGQLAARRDLDLSAGQVMGMLRNLMPDRVVALDSVMCIFRYQPTEQTTAAIKATRAAGLVDEPSPGTLTLTAEGRDLIGEMYEVMGPVADSLWESEGERVDELLPLVERVVGAASESGGAAFSVIWPIWRPAGMSPVVLLSELLAPLRFHRFDAHIAAWSAAGLTVDQVQALEPGEQHDAIERETNRLAGEPYKSLDPAERNALVEQLALLPS